jgi:TRAP-type C4-dicarboxylate transport system substrate-binding protein
MNKRWFDKLPADLQQVLLQAITEESAKTRAATRKQQAEQIAAAKAAGVEFIPLAAADRELLIKKAAPVYKEWGQKIGSDYLNKVRTTLGK